MVLQLYTLSGSPFGWKVELALAHKGVAYQATQLSPDRGDLASAGFLGLNPRGKLPVLVDDDLILGESDAILAYVDEAFPAFGPPLFARDAKQRAVERMMVIGASAYLYPPVRKLVMAWTRPGAEIEPAAVAEAKGAIGQELAQLAERLVAPFFASEGPGAVDFTVLPLVALVKRLAAKRPEEALEALVPPPLAAWREAMETLPAYDQTYPPHWRAS